MVFAMDFKSDWHEILKDVMSSRWGVDVTGVSENIPILFFNTIHRRIQPRPRVIYLADSFKCPKDLEAGWGRIKSSVENGEDITAHLSKFVAEVERTDAMLNDWGIHHFHLGATMKKNWVARTGRLLFARVTSDAFYVIGIYDHEAWADDEIVETVHRNWPRTISKWRMHGASGQPMTKEQRKAFRKKNINALFLTSDQTTYGPIGGGMTMSGHNISAVTEMDRFHDFLERLEDRLRETAPVIEPHLTAHGHQADAEIVTKLKLTKGYYSAFFPNYSLMVNFYPRAAGDGGVSP